MVSSCRPVCVFMKISSTRLGLLGNEGSFSVATVLRQRHTAIMVQYSTVESGTRSKSRTGSEDDDCVLEIDGNTEAEDSGICSTNSSVATPNKAPYKTLLKMIQGRKITKTA